MIIKAIDDIKIGMWLMVIEYHATPDTGYEDSYSFLNPRPRRGPEEWPLPPVAMPFRVLAVERPFILIANETNAARPLDFRRVQRVQTVGARYVTMFDARLDERHQRGDCYQLGPLAAYGARGSGKVVKRRRKKEAPDKMSCPRCGGRRVERLTDPGSGVWVPRCKECGYTGGDGGITKTTDPPK